MANPIKAARRTRRALGTLTKKTAERLEDVLNNPGGVNANNLTEKIVRQFFDGVEAWLGIIRSFAEEPPTAFLKADISGGATAPDATVDLDEPVAAIGNLTATTLISPGIAKTLAMALESVPHPAVGDVERIKITVNVPAAQDEGLYGGFISIGKVVQVKVYVWVHK